MKTLQQLHDEQDKLPKVHAQVEAELKKIPGVIAVDVGFKKTKGETTDTLSFIVYVEDKKNESDLSTDHIIPKEIHGVKTDVVQIPSGTSANGSLPDKDKYRPLKGGIQISNGIRDANRQYSVGTIGCFANLTSDGSLVGLSNHHVMFAKGGHGPTGDKDGSKIGQPEFWVSCFCCDCDDIGTILNGIHDGVVDSAICSIGSGIERLNEIEGIGTVQGAAATFDVAGITTSIRAGDPVKKRGRTTGLTTGTVNSINYAMNKEGTLFTGQIHTLPDNPGDMFHEGGDSGSVILNASDEVIALHMGGPYISGTTDFDGSSAANKIHEVTNRLGITIPSAAFASGGGSSATLIREGTAAASIIPSPAELSINNRVNYLENRLNMSDLGRTIITLFYRHRTEVRDMINTCRPATVAWNRNQGPGFLASIVKSVRNLEFNFKTQINGISIIALIDTMRKVFLEHGSIALREDIYRYSEKLIGAFTTGNNAHGIVEKIALTE